MVSAPNAAAASVSVLANIANLLVHKSRFGRRRRRDRDPIPTPAFVDIGLIG
jgi:hypothetical protein